MIAVSEWWVPRPTALRGAWHPEIVPALSNIRPAFLNRRTKKVGQRPKRACLTQVFRPSIAKWWSSVPLATAGHRGRLIKPGARQCLPLEIKRHSHWRAKALASGTKGHPQFGSGRITTFAARAAVPATIFWSFAPSPPTPLPRGSRGERIKERAPFGPQGFCSSFILPPSSLKKRCPGEMGHFSHQGICRRATFPHYRLMRAREIGSFTIGKVFSQRPEVGGRGKKRKRFPFPPWRFCRPLTSDL
jgi:hypothetical protein